MFLYFQPCAEAITTAELGLLALEVFSIPLQLLPSHRGYG